MQKCVQPTLTFNEAERAKWDVVVVGAGPAGSMAARSTAQLGLRVLLLDREQFPRPKVCGCCVNQAALGLLEEHERTSIESQGNRLRSYELASGGKVARVELSGGMAISRERLDSHLINAAIKSGAHFLDATSATLEPNSPKCQLKLKCGQRTGTVHGRVALLATGLSGAEDRRRRSSRSYIGGGATLAAENLSVEPGTVSMACHRSGYVGIVRLEDGRLDLAAAFDAAFVKQLGGLSNAAHQVIAESGLSVPHGILDERWQGTVKLTHRRPKLFGACYLVIGDAAGYVEPFTGEGIAWAMASGQAVATCAHRALTESLLVVGPAWSSEYRRTLGRRIRVCRAVSFLLRQPTLVKVAIHALQLRPQLAGPIQRSLNTPFAFVD